MPSNVAQLLLLCRVLSENRAVRTRAIAEMSRDESGAAVLALAQREKLLPTLYEAISDFPDCLPKSERVALAIAHEANRRKNREIRDAVIEIAGEADRHSTPVVALKGARWLIEDSARCAAWRPMIDLDILVPVGDYGDMRSVLERMGYRSVRRERNFLGQERFAGHYHLVALRRDTQPFVTEVHRHVGWQPELLTTEAIFEGSHQVAPGLRLACPWHAALHAIVHWQIHHYGYRLGFHRVSDGLDISRFLARDDVDWNALADHAARVGIGREVDAALSTAADVFAARLPARFQVSAQARRYVTRALQTRDSRPLAWQAKQQQRIDRLWHDHRFVYRSALRKTDPYVTRIGLWTLRACRLPFLLSHLASVAILRVAVSLQRVLRWR
jgi:hypothetical protein